MPKAPRISSTLIFRSDAILMLITVPSFLIGSSDDVVTRFDSTGREAAVREDVEGRLRWLAREPLREQVSNGRRLLEAMAGEAASAPETFDGIHRPQDRLVVGCHLVQTRPRGLDPGGPQPAPAAVRYGGPRLR